MYLLKKMFGKILNIIEIKISFIFKFSLNPYFQPFQWECFQMNDGGY